MLHPPSLIPLLQAKSGRRRLEPTYRGCHRLKLGIMGRTAMARVQVPLLPPSRLTFALTAGALTQVRSDIRPPNHRSRPTRLQHLLFNPYHQNTRPSNRHRLSCNLKLRYVRVQKPKTDSSCKGPRFQGCFTVVHDHPHRKDTSPVFQRQGEIRESGRGEETSTRPCCRVPRMYDEQWTRFTPVRERLRAREEYPREGVQGFSYVYKVGYFIHPQASVRVCGDHYLRYDLPTCFTPSISHPIPSNVLNPLPHVFALASTLTPLLVSIRLLVPSESPSSRTFTLSNVLSSGLDGADVLSEASATLIAQVGKMKRTGLRWEDKASFLEFYSRR